MAGRLKQFFSYVEIRTKLASFFPFLLGLFYGLYAYGQIIWLNTALFFVSMICFDMATTALNNYMDTKVNKAPLPLDKGTARRLLFLLLAIAAISGLFLVWQAGLIVLACGALCFLVGIIYTFGPVTISHLPLGEAFSGIFMGFFIPFLTIFINAPPDRLVDYAFEGPVFLLSVNLMAILKLIILTIPAITGIAGIMLANNICDLDYDRSINRFTLPHYIGVKNALRLFAGLYYVAFAAIIAMVILKVLPLYGLVILLAMIPIQANLRKFSKMQIKRVTFPLSVQNFTLIIVMQIAVVVLALFLR